MVSAVMVSHHLHYIKGNVKALNSAGHMAI